MSEDSMKIREQIKLIKNLKMPPDIVINIKVTHSYYFLFYEPL